MVCKGQDECSSDGVRLAWLPGEYDSRNEPLAGQNNDQNCQFQAPRRRPINLSALIFQADARSIVPNQVPPPVVAAVRQPGGLGIGRDHFGGLPLGFEAEVAHFLF
jgi:hypothetical protein